MSSRGRLVSVDVFRGLTVAGMLLVNNPGDWGHIFWPLKHSVWNGCTPTDLVFPFFLFIAGVSTSLGFGSRLDAGGDASTLSHTVLARAFRILALGLVLHAIAYWTMGMSAYRPFGVLQRIGICFGAAGFIAINTRARTQWMIIVGILAGYWALMTWGGPLTKEANLASRLDTALLGRYAYEFDPATGLGNEPEGVLSTFPAIVTTLLGVRAGEWLRRGELRHLLLAGVAALSGGWLWSFVFPFNKELWTSSYTLWSAGWAMFALLACHILIDKKGLPPIGRRFGVNAIAIYAGGWLAVCIIVWGRYMAPIYTYGFEWMVPYLGLYATSLVYAVLFVAFWWVVALILDRKKIYIKV
jgi:predicted acyltransferase